MILLGLLALFLVPPPTSPPISTPTPPPTYTLAITETTGGTTNPAPGNYTYPEGSPVTVAATAFTGYVFDYWNLDGSKIAGLPSIVDVTMDANHTLHAVFALVTHTLTISRTTGGTTSPAPGDHIFAHGTEVQVNATANTGYVLDHWELDSSDVGSAIPYVVTMNTDHILHAVFKPLYILTITTTAGGTTDPEPGSYQFFEGTVASVTAIPETDFVLDHWELDGVNQGASNPINVTMNANHTLLAVFKPLYTLTITCTTGGTTDPSPNKYQHREGIVVEVTAIAGSSYVFDHWELDTVDMGGDNPISVTMNADHTLHAVFTQITYTLSISVTGEGTTDPGEGSHVYGSGSTATVSATADSGWYFDHWILDGGDAGSTIPINVLMDSEHDLEAVFTKTNYTLTITTTTGGTTSPAPGDHVYSPGTNVPVTAIPDACVQFDHWELDSLDAGSANPYTVTMDDDHTLHAVFKPLYTLTITSTAGGTTDPAPGSYQHPRGTDIIVTAIADSGYVFERWELDGVNLGSVTSISVTMNKDHTLHAVFKKHPTPVGGYALPINIDTSSSLAPQIGLAFALIAAMAVTIILIRRRNKTLK